MFLREVQDGDTLIAVTFDEASQNFGDTPKKLLLKLGSKKVDVFSKNLRYHFLFAAKSGTGVLQEIAQPFTPGNRFRPPYFRFCIPV
jgi:hypothetical protein